jgi:uncharacterized surface protein with fasciclin (FAS1) repeats
MKKTVIAIATASALLGAGTVSAHCAYHKADGHQGGGKAVMQSNNPHHGIVLTDGHGMQKAAAPDIVDTAVAAGSFSMLVKAVQATGLVETLKGDGPFTVFAPTDAAFAKLPAGTLEALLSDKEKLAQILKYHVVPGKLDAGKVTGMSKLATVEGSELPVNSIKIATTDIVTSNGIIHVIDEVLIPNG